jgi:hypothetical protein
VAARACEDWLTRKQLAQRIARSYGHVRTLQARGEIRGKRGDDGVWRYDASQVDALLAKRPIKIGRRRPGQGEQAARAFELFAQGKRNREVVVALREAPERVRELRREFVEPDEVIVSAAVRARVEAAVEAAGYPVTWDERLADTFEALVRADRALTTFYVERATGDSDADAETRTPVPRRRRSRSGGPAARAARAG